MTTMNLDDYLARIGFEGAPTATLACLREIHRRHLLSVTYENVDVQLGVPLDTEVRNAYDKIVNRRRGGWCYEMNGVLGWALREIGFDIIAVAGGVGRFARGDAALGNHLVLLADIEEQRWVVDAGFGDGFIEPVPLREHTFEQRGFDFRLEMQDDGYWRLHNHKFGGAPSFDFSEKPADSALLSNQCQTLQTAPESPFVNALVCQRFTEQGYEIQLGRIAKSITPNNEARETLETRDAFGERLNSVFGIELDTPEIDRLWEKVVAAHERHFSEAH